MPTCTCPECGRPCTPVYCAASTPEAPILLAYTVSQAAQRLGLRHPRTLNPWLTPWQGGWKLLGYSRRRRLTGRERRSA